MIVPIEYIEIVDDGFGPEARIAGTRIGVDEVVMMHFRNRASIDWIVENFEVLSYAKVHAALVYYYDHQAVIDAILDAPYELPVGARDATEHLAQLRARHQQRQQNDD